MPDIDPESSHAVWRELDDLTKVRLRQAMREPLDDEGVFLAEMWVGSCVHCGSELTMDLTGVEGLENPAVALCKTCGGMWCIECCAPIITPDLECGHYAVCAECGECDICGAPGETGETGEISLLDGFMEDEEDEEDVGYIEPRDCGLIRAWLIEQGFSTEEDFMEEFDYFDDWDEWEEEEEDVDEVLFCCAWCNRELLPGDRVFWSRLDLKPGFEFHGEEGLIVPLSLPTTNRTIMAILTSLDNPEDPGEKRLIVITCGDECSDELKEAFRLEQNINERFNIN